MKNFRKNQGITLVALVVTIIIIIILATVAINFAFGDNGLIRRAQGASDYYMNDIEYTDRSIANVESYLYEIVNDVEVEQVTDENPGVLEGSGVANDPYTINSIEDLVFFAYDVSDGNTYEGQTVKLGLSLDFNSNKSYVEPLRTDYEEYGYNGELKTLLTTGEGFKPIGTTIRNDNSEKYSFAGIFDGNGKIISNLYINIDFGDKEPNYQCALFGLNYGVIQNLGIEKCNITAKAGTCLECASIAGRNSGEINNCYSSGKMTYEVNVRTYRRNRRQLIWYNTQ